MITLSYQENYQILVFGYVFKAKFKNQSPEDYFRQTAAKPVLKLLQYYRQYPELPTGLDDYPPDDSSSLEDQLIYVLRSNDARFKSNVIRRFNGTLTDAEILRTVPSSLPSITFSGTTYIYRTRAIVTSSLYFFLPHFPLRFSL